LLIVTVGAAPKAPVTDALPGGPVGAAAEPELDAVLDAVECGPADEQATARTPTHAVAAIVRSTGVPR
jgi:hypothetical protein